MPHSLLWVMAETSYLLASWAFLLLHSVLFITPDWSVYFTNLNMSSSFLKLFPESPLFKEWSRNSWAWHPISFVFGVLFILSALFLTIAHSRHIQLFTWCSPNMIWALSLSLSGTFPCWNPVPALSGNILLTPIEDYSLEVKHSANFGHFSTIYLWVKCSSL